MAYINHTINGVPYGMQKARGDIQAPARWTARIIEATQSLPRVKEACVMKITFLLPPDKYPADLPFGPDIDNLLKRFLDALNQTIFFEAKGKDSCVVAITAMKTRVASSQEAGVHFEVLPVSTR